MRRRQRLKPDTRPHWDDPDLPVLAGGESYTAAQMQAWAQRSISDLSRWVNWRTDPSYWWARQRKRLTLG